MEKWSLKGRKKYLSKNTFNAKLYEIMVSKSSNLCLAIDLNDAADILDVNFLKLIQIFWYSFKN